MENNVQKTNGRKMTREEVINRMMAHQEERRLKAEYRDEIRKNQEVKKNENLLVRQMRGIL